jgi:hypothetical protein
MPKKFVEQTNHEYLEADIDTQIARIDRDMEALKAERLVWKHRKDNAV